MALQNVRSLLWRGEDLGYGGGNTREQIFNVTVPAGARPQMTTQGFAGAVPVTSLLGTTASIQQNGQLRVLMNRSPDYWITLTCLYFNGTGMGQVQIPIAPLQQLFLPQNLVGPGTISANSTWPIPQPPAGSPGSQVPLASAQNILTFDWLDEN